MSENEIISAKKPLKKKPHYCGHRDRLRERYLKDGGDTWQDYELLELLLTYYVPRSDTKPLAKRLLVQYKSLPGVLEASSEHLIKHAGLAPSGAILLKLCAAIARRNLKSPLHDRQSIATPQAVIDYLSATLRGKTHEEMHALFLDNGNRLIAADALINGTVNHAAVYPRKIVEHAIKHSAASVIIAHNHPGGTGKPSPSDIQSTEAIRHALETIDISLLDHIIITDSTSFSFKQQGLL